MESLALGSGGVLWIASSRLFTYHCGAVLSDRAACLLDPGLLPEEIDGLAQHATDLGATVTSIVLTHGHWDHILAPETMPSVRVIAHAAFPRDGSDGRASRVARQVDKWRLEQGIEAERGFRVPLPDEVFQSTHDHTVGDVSIRLIHAPGHAVDHSVVYFAEEGILWAADMLSDYEIPYVCHSLLQYAQTLESLSSLQPSVLIPTHGTITNDALEIRRRFDADRDYLDLVRGCVERAVRTGCTVEEAVERCSSLDYANADENRRAHELNVEHAFCELGGEADATSLGWNRVHQ